jgi:threonine dehydrogenase-like Zn-dependent dehydrogenase
MSTMKAVVFKGVGQVSVEQRAIPQLQEPRDAIVKVNIAALCGSDLHWYRGQQKIPSGFIPGHEFTGTIHQVGSQVQRLKVGDKVVVSLPNMVYYHLISHNVVQASFTTQCGECFYCIRKQTSRCTNSFLFGESLGMFCICTWLETHY